MLLFAVACGDDDDDADANGNNGGTTPQATTTNGETEPEFDNVNITLLLGVDTPDYTNLVEYAAVDILAERGINMSIEFTGDGETAVQQVVQGRAEIADLPIVGFVPAIAQGAEIDMVLSTARQSFAYASTPSITTVEDLAGTTIAVHSEVSFTKAVTDALIQKYDLQDTTELIMPGSEVRLQALVNGQIDATTVALADLIRAQATAPDAINVLSTVSEEFPGLLYVVVGWDQNWAAENPDVAQAVVDAMREADERVSSDPAYAMQVAERMLPDEDPAVQEEIVNQVLESGITNTNELTLETGQETMQFFYDFGSIEVDPATADLSEYFDLTWSEAID